MSKEAINAALDKKAENAKSLGLDYEPPQRPWVNATTWRGLTDEEMYMNCPSWLSQEQCKAWIHQIEAALRSKNT
jgi:hypothetical protein